MEFRYYETPEYQKLSKQQKAELKEYREQMLAKGEDFMLLPDKGGKKTKRKGSDKKGPGNKKIKSMIAQAVAEQMNKPAASTKKQGKLEADKALGYLVSLIEAGQEQKESKSKKVTIAATETTEPERKEAPVTLQSILKATRRGN